jgi:hypothetical protein
MTTFGVEYECDVNAPELVQWLRMNHPDEIGSDSLHSYHCDCDTCDSDYTFRAQRDSSCSGEIISTVFNSDFMDDAVESLKLLEEGSIAVDAEPGPNSGFHVHVGVNEHQLRYSQPSQHLADAYFEFVRWENIITQIASGRFRFNRNNNHSVQTLAHEFLTNLDGEPWAYQDSQIYDFERDRYIANPNYNPDQESRTPTQVLHMVAESDHVDRVKMDLLLGSHDWDRHSNLATRTRHNTWEFRVFNSTRAAWRMELWVRTALAFMQPEFVDELKQQEVTSMPNFTMALDAVDSAAAVLCARQVHYVNTRDWDNLPALTVA